MENKIKLNKNKLLYTLLTTQAVSIIGTRMTGIALGIWVFQKTGHATDLLLIPFFAEMPQLLFGHYLGVLIDRFKRKWVLVLSDFGQALGTWGLILLILSGWFQIWHLYVIVFFQGIFSAMQTPAADATVTFLTDETNRARVNGVKEMLFPTASIVAPVIAGIVYVNFGIQGVVAIDLLSFLAGSLVVIFMKFPDIPLAVENTINEGMKVGVNYLLKTKALLGLIAYVAVVNFLLNGPLELVIPYILSITGSEMILSAMMAIMSGAAFLGGLIVTIFGLPKNKNKLMLLMMVLTGISMLAFGISRQSIGLSLFLILCVVPLPILNAIFRTVLQDTVPGPLQGRVFSIAYQVAYGLAPISFLVVGPVVDHIFEPALQNGNLGWITSIFGDSVGSGMGFMLGIAGLLIVFTTFIYYFKARKHKYEII